MRVCAVTCFTTTGAGITLAMVSMASDQTVYLVVGLRLATLPHGTTQKTRRMRDEDQVVDRVKAKTGRVHDNSRTIAMTNPHPQGLLYV